MSEQVATYASWSALLAATKAAAAQDAKAGGADVSSHLAMARADRFLCRVFADGESSQWLLKGGTSMLARVRQTRTTKDVDLAGSRKSVEEAVDALCECASRDLGDHVRFELTRNRITGQGDNQPGVETRRLVFTAFDQQTGRRIGDVPVDLVVEPPPVGDIEMIEPVNRLRLGRPVQSSPYRLFPIADQIADKVCATHMRYSGNKPSSRVKDLVDLVVIARTQRVDLDQLRLAIETKRVLSRLDSFDTFTTPEGWDTTYRRLARSTHATGGVHDIDDARQLVRELVDSALQPPHDQKQTWVPEQGWGHARGADEDHHVDKSSGGNDQVHVRAHIRGGHPVAEHHRAPRQYDSG